MLIAPVWVPRNHQIFLETLVRILCCLELSSCRLSSLKNVLATFQDETVGHTLSLLAIFFMAGLVGLDHLILRVFPSEIVLRGENGVASDAMDLMCWSEMLVCRYSVAIGFRPMLQYRLEGADVPKLECTKENHQRTYASEVLVYADGYLNEKANTSFFSESRLSFSKPYTRHFIAAHASRSPTEVYLKNHRLEIRTICRRSNPTTTLALNR